MTTVFDQSSETASPRATDAPQPALSIVVCTHNRADLLALLLADLAPQLDPSIECIVVDSASRPDQAEHVRIAVAGVPTARLIRLETAGVSHARNAGLVDVRSPWMAFLDDDERLGPTWLADVLALLQRLPEDCGTCGGNVLPIFPDGLPDLGPRWLAYLSVVDRPGEYDQTDDPRFGTGHALIRMEAARAVGLFDPRLGRVGGSLLSGEDVLFVHRLTEAGWRIWHSDRISVGHTIEPERLTRGWVRQRAYWEGITAARILKIVDRRKLRRFVPGLLAKGLLLCLARPIAPSRWEVDLRLAYIAGYLRGYGGALLPGGSAEQSGKVTRDAA